MSLLLSLAIIDRSFTVCLSLSHVALSTTLNISSAFVVSLKTLQIKDASYTSGTSGVMILYKWYQGRYHFIQVIPAASSYYTTDGNNILCICAYVSSMRLCRRNMQRLDRNVIYHAIHKRSDVKVIANGCEWPLNNGWISESMWLWMCRSMRSVL